MKKKNIILYVTIGFIFLIGAYLTYKTYIINKYSFNDEIKLDISLKEPWKIEVKTLKDKEYFKLGEVRIRNEFKKFKRDENKNSYSLKDKEGNQTANISYFKYVTYTDGLTTNLIINGSTDQDQKVIEEFMEKHEFKDDTEFIKYLLEYEQKKQNLFANTKMIKDGYVAEYLKNNILEDGNIYILEGDYKGYVIEDEEKFEANILDENTKHIITFKGKDYFDKEKVMELLSTIDIL